MICVYTTGTVVVQGTNKDRVSGLKEKLAELEASGSGVAAPSGKKVFVVYGHAETRRTELEAMLRRWGLEPILLDQLTSEGDTLIEKLERVGKDVAFAVVLATADDEGHPKGKATEKKFRVRQNVVLELGMMLNKLGRKRVAILLEKLDDGVLERPSDIDGLIYIPFTDKIDDARVQLAKEMDKQGLKVDLSSL